jgi:predicted nucleic acid-binding protein
MRICIDSGVFIRGLADTSSSSAKVLDSIGINVRVTIPRLIAQEVSRNLKSEAQIRSFYRLSHERDFALIVDEPVPRYLVEKYIERGLREKGDAFIGAFAEWQNADYLILINRHFLRDLRPEGFLVIHPDAFTDLPHQS